jgi:hypothetical protein
MRTPAIALLALGCAASVPGNTPLPEGFWAAWGDGQAEVAGYRLVQPRYGALRRGEAVLITVTEDFLGDRLVKADGPAPGVFPVLKLNEVRDFTTGVYDYNVMSSTFFPLDGRFPAGVPVKVTFSSQEWCGHVWDQVTLRNHEMRHVWHSYFASEGEGDQRAAVPKDAVFADAGALWARDLAGEAVPAGSSRAVRVWPRAIDARFDHEPANFVAGTASRDAATSTVRVPAGTFEVRRTRLLYGDQDLSWWVEVAPPHRLVAWEAANGERAELAGAARMPYWKLQQEGDERLRASLGLAPLRPGELVDRKPLETNVQ